MFVYFLIRHIRNIQMTYEDFLAYFQYKAFDVLSSGNYKRYITQCKENSDSWAIEMYVRQNKIQQNIKFLHVKLNSISQNKLGIACKSVMNSAQPPIRIFIGFSTCFITGVRAEKCLDLSKNGKKNMEIHVHPKFAFFFLFVWYICKLEYVIRACTKHWIEVNNKQKSSSVNHPLLDEFMLQNEVVCRGLYSVYEKAFSYVQTSLDLYEEEFTAKPILQPHASFWDEIEKNIAIM